MAEPVHIPGGAKTDFARNWSREGLGIGALMAEAPEAGLAATAPEHREIDTVHVGNVTGALFCGQGQPGGIVASLHPDLSGIPTSRHEAACASGSMALLAAAAEIEAGRHGLACVPGVECMRNLPGLTATRHLGAAAGVGRGFEDATQVWPRAFSDLTEACAGKYGGADDRHPGEIARINHANAKRNPNAQTRRWAFTDASFTEDDAANPVIEGRVRRNDCGQPHRRGGGGVPRLARAGIPDVRALDAIETHDCFAMTEYAAIDHFGITAPGEAWKAVEDGTIPPRRPASRQPLGRADGPRPPRRRDRVAHGARRRPPP